MAVTMEENVIEVKNVTKAFKVYLDKSNTLKEKIIFRNRRRFEEKKVLNGISFNVKRGEAVGLIGHNGCGKSTTLKLLTRIMYPDSGSINIKGRVSSLIELGAGFHPDMSGRENIYINASIFGLTKKEIDNKLYDIIQFSELEDYIDNPVRTYSSGMYMRLAFSVAISVNADVLLIDEILAVGDVNFQQKCFDKLKQIKREGTTIVIVSHSLSQIEQICERSIWIDGGKIREEGRPKEVHEKYLSTMEIQRMDRIEEEEKQKREKEKQNKEQEEKVVTEEEKASEEVIQEAEEKTKKLPAFCAGNAIRRGNQKIEFTDMYMLDPENKKKKLARTGDQISFVIKYCCREPVEEAVFGIGIYRDDEAYCFGTNTDIELKHPIEMKRDGEMEIKIPDLQLLAGKYNVNIAIHSKDVAEIYDYIWNAFEFQVFNKKGDDGLFRMKMVWIQDGVEIINTAEN